MSSETPAVWEALAVYATEAPEMERVPPGYRQTEVGVIPEEWEVSKLENLGQWKGGATPSMRNPAYWSGGLIPWASSGDIKVVLLKKTQLNITETAVKQTSTSLLPKDSIIVVTRSGILRKHLPVAKNIVPLAINQDLKALLPSHDIEADFVLYQLIANGPKILATCQKAGTTVESVEYAWLKAFLISKPSTKVEQRAIAAALSDVDALIAALDKLIAKKRAVKTAAMQQLLTGKQRLPGFSGEWEVKRLGDVCQIISGGTPSTSIPAFWTGEILWCTPTDITENNAKYLFRTNRSISEEGLKHSSAVLLPRGALLLCTRATVGEIKIAAVPVCTNQGFKSLVCGSDASNEFLFYKLVTLKDRLRELGVGSTFLEVSRKDVAALEIPLPKLKEQTSIAAVLSDMDAEIEALEARREKTRRIKQGMMQELLTGRTRLV